MIVEFSCPKCGKALQAADKYSGKRAQCRACRTTFMVPGIPAIHEAENRPEDRNSKRLDTPPEQDFSHPLAMDDSSEAADPVERQVPVRDASFGIASLYLATLAFLLFFTPVLLASLAGSLGVSIALFAA